MEPLQTKVLFNAQVLWTVSNSRIIMCYGLALHLDCDDCCCVV